MLKRRFLASLTAVTLTGAISPAAAVITLNLAAVTDTLSVDSDTEAYDLWASTCPNVSVGGTCGTATGAQPLNSDNTLFFWGDGGFDPADPIAPTPNPNNTRINVKWAGASASEEIRSIRIRTTGTTPLGQAAGPLPFMAIDSPDAGWEATFSSDPRPSGAGTISQGQGAFLAYGREVYAPDEATDAADWNTTRYAVYPFTVSFEVGVFGPGAQTAPTKTVPVPSAFSLVEFPTGGTATPDPREAQLRPLDFTVNLPNGDRGVLNPGDVLEIEFFVEGFDPDEVPGTVPVGYMDDIEIQLNPGPRLQATPAGTVDIGATRAGTVTDVSERGSIDATNIGGDDGSGNSVLDGQFNAVSNAPGNLANAAIQPVGGNGVQTFELNPSAVDTRDFELDATAFELTLADEASTGGSFSATQQIAVTGAGDFGGSQARTLQSTVVGPILGVAGQPDPGTPAQTLAYGSTIDLGDLGLGVATTSILALGNLFGADLGQVTDLTIQNAALDDSFGGRFNLLGGDCASPNPYSAGSTVGGATGNEPDQFQLPDLCISFAPGSYPGGGTPTGSPNEYERTFNTTLRFFTDMNMAYGSTPVIGDAGEKFFNITLTAIYEFTPSAPVPGPLALIGIGLAGLGGLHVRSRRGTEPKARSR
jgi:hypothetical protein